MKLHRTSTGDQLPLIQSPSLQLLFPIVSYPTSRYLKETDYPPRISLPVRRSSSPAKWTSSSRNRIRLLLQGRRDLSEIDGFLRSFVCTGGSRDNVVGNTWKRSCTATCLARPVVRNCVGLGTFVINFNKKFPPSLVTQNVVGITSMLWVEFVTLLVFREVTPTPCSISETCKGLLAAPPSNRMLERSKQAVHEWDDDSCVFGGGRQKEARKVGCCGQVTDREQIARLSMEFPHGASIFVRVHARAKNTVTTTRAIFNCGIIDGRTAPIYF